MKGRAETTADIPPPPWQLSGPFACIGVAFDEAGVRAWLPPQFEMTPGATGGFYHYEARAGWGVAPYVAGLVYLDVEGYDAPDGTRGKLPVACWFSDRGRAGFDRWLGIPGVFAGEAAISATGDIVHARSGPPGETRLDCAMRLTGDEAATPMGSGVNYWVWDRDGEVRGMACAFTSRFVEAEPLHATLTLPPPMDRLRVRDLLWAGFMSEASFNISSPYVLGSSLRVARPGREAAYLALLGELGLGAVVVRVDGRPLFVNAVARGLVGDGLALRGGAIGPADGALGPAFRDALAAVLAAGTPAAPLALPRASARKPLILQMFRLNAEAAGMPSDPAALLLVTDPDRGAGADPVRALQLLGLTPSEARIAALVGSGLSPREAGEMAGNTEGTVRSTLRQVYGKLDIGRQSELARLVTRLGTLGA